MHRIGPAKLGMYFLAVFVAAASSCSVAIAQSAQARRVPETFQSLLSFSDDGNGADPGRIVVRLTTGPRDRPMQIVGITSSGGPSDAGVAYTFGPEAHEFSRIAVAPDEAPALVGLVGALDDYTFDGPLYGTSLEHSAGYGAVYRLNPSDGISVVHMFSPHGGDGTYPTGDLVRYADGSYYGLTEEGGTYNNGTIFQIGPQGQYDVVYSFRTIPSALSTRFERDGGRGYGSARLAPFLYVSAGPALFAFSLQTHTLSTVYTLPSTARGGVVASSLSPGRNGNVYGVATGGGADLGSLFAFSFSSDTHATYTLLHRFSGSDGAYPFGAVTVESNADLYGTSETLGASCCGTIWKYSAGIFTVLHSFSGPDGSAPSAKLVDGLDGYLYGTTNFGGSAYGPAILDTERCSESVSRRRFAHFAEAHSHLMDAGRPKCGITTVPVRHNVWEAVPIRLEGVRGDDRFHSPPTDLLLLSCTGSSAS